MGLEVDWILLELGINWIVKMLLELEIDLILPESGINWIVKMLLELEIDCSEIHL